MREERSKTYLKKYTVIYDINQMGVVAKLVLYSLD